MNRLKYILIFLSLTWFYIRKLNYSYAADSS